MLGRRRLDSVPRVCAAGIGPRLPPWRLPLALADAFLSAVSWSAVRHLRYRRETFRASVRHPRLGGAQAAYCTRTEREGRDEMASAIGDPERRFEIPGLVEIVEGNSGLEKVVITSPACQGEMYLHGAHITSWKPAGKEEVLFLSTRSHWEDGRPIRGGIPVCFPWFAHKGDDPGAPDHGFVRTKAWQLQS